MPATGAPDPSKRLPALRPLATAISAARVGRRRLVGDSVSYLVSHSADMAAWDSVEDLVLALHDGDSSSSTARGIVHHLQVVRAELARQLWARHVFVGITVLDELLYTVTAEDAGDRKSVV